MSQKITMDGRGYATLRDAIRDWPTRGDLWIDGEPYTYEVDDGIAHVFNGEGIEEFTFSLRGTR